MEARQSRGAISRRVPARESSAGGREKAACQKAERVREVGRWERPPCDVDGQEACPLARLAEREKARPKGAWDEEREAGPSGTSGVCVGAAPVVVVRGCPELLERRRERDKVV